MTIYAPRRRNAGLTVTVTDARGRAVEGGPSSGLAFWLRRAAPRTARGAVSIALMSDETMRRLNRRFRNVDRPTDVLSFPADDAGAGGTGRPAGVRVLGDLAIATGVAARQARQLGHSLETELKVLALHGLLHLLGYDHEVDEGRMARTEERLRKQAGLSSGLIRRRPAPRRALQR